MNGIKILAFIGTLLIVQGFLVNGQRNIAPKGRNSNNLLDLHGKTVKEAILESRTFLQAPHYAPAVKIITGRGLHSRGGVPKIKPALQSLLNKNRCMFKQEDKGGSFKIDLPCNI